MSNRGLVRFNKLRQGAGGGGDCGARRGSRDPNTLKGDTLVKSCIMRGFQSIATALGAYMGV